MSKLFTNSLTHNRIEIVKLVLEYIQDKELFKKYLDKYLEILYMVSPVFVKILNICDEHCGMIKAAALETFVQYLVEYNMTCLVIAVAKLLIF